MVKIEEVEALCSVMQKEEQDVSQGDWMEKAIIFQIILLAVQGGLYLGVQKLEGPAHNVKSRYAEWKSVGDTISM